jgi:hypothetical protein
MPRSAPIGRFSAASAVPSALVASPWISKRVIANQLIANRLIANQLIANQLLANLSIARPPVPNRPVLNPLNASQLMDGPPKPDRSPQPGFGPGQLLTIGQVRGEQP